jgi:hypothetical protein
MCWWPGCNTAFDSGSCSTSLTSRFRRVALCDFEIGMLES